MWDRATTLQNMGHPVDKVEVINKSENAVQCLVEFNRRLKNNESYATARGVWVATKKNGHWGLQIRAMIPIAGKISILAGAKLNNELRTKN